MSPQAIKTKLLMVNMMFCMRFFFRTNIDKRITIGKKTERKTGETKDI